MSLPAPAPGLVIRYAFLWSHEAERGATEGAKDRPAAVVVASKAEDSDDVRVTVVPVTHSEPDDLQSALEIPANVARTLGFDTGRHWLKLTEVNRFAWPGYDLRPVPGTGAYAYGMLPEALYERMRDRLLELAKAGRAKSQNRD